MTLRWNILSQECGFIHKWIACWNKITKIQKKSKRETTDTENKKKL